MRRTIQSIGLSAAKRDELFERLAMGGREG